MYIFDKISVFDNADKHTVIETNKHTQSLKMCIPVLIKDSNFSLQIPLEGHINKY